MMKRIVAGIVVSALLATSLPALAEHREGHWEGREIHRFGEHDLVIWQGGHWYHRHHNGLYGWWWVTAGVWYFYPSPVYPYPDPYTPPVIIINQQPPVMVTPQTTAPAQPPAQFWYYCDSVKGYYPYVSNCPEGWRSVPAQPPQTAPR